MYLYVLRSLLLLESIVGNFGYESSLERVILVDDVGVYLEGIDDVFGD